MSSRYTKTAGRSAKVRSISHWKDWEVFLSPKGMKRYSNKPKGVVMAVGDVSGGDGHLVVPLD